MVMTTGDGEALGKLEVALNEKMPGLLAEVGRLLERDWPDYAQFLRDSSMQVSGAGVMFVHRLLDMAQRGFPNLEPAMPESEPAAQIVFEQIGRVQWANGRELPELLTAYQVGARVAWRHVSDTALELGLEPAVLAALADAVFVFVNELSSASAHGYVLEQSESSAARERQREELSELLLSDRAESGAIRGAARRAGWRLPSQAAVILVDPADEGARGILDRLGAGALPIRGHELYGAIIASVTPRADAERATKYLRGAHAVVGFGVPLTLLPASFRIAQIALALRQRALLEGDPVFANEHLDTIIAHRDERLINALRTQVLQPLEDLPATTRTRLAETLASWLRHMGDRHAVAEELHIHPQTVRYRLGRLREYFGDELDSPRSRARMFLALVWGPAAS